MSLASETQDKQINMITKAYKISQATALLVAAFSLYAVNNVDEDGAFDLHHNIPAIVAQHTKGLSETYKVAATADLTEMADKAELEFLEGCATYSVLAGLNMLFFNKMMNDAIKRRNEAAGPKNGPRNG